MSSTEIYTFNKAGDAELYEEVQNSWRGAMAVWNILGKRHLHCTMSPATANAIWALGDDLSVPEHERIALFTTYDHCLVRAENIPKVIAAFQKFDGDTSLREQANILQEIAKDPDVIAVGWNQTSVNCSEWSNSGEYDAEAECNRPYNCLTGDKHFWLFDELKKEDSYAQTNNP